RRQRLICASSATTPTTIRSSKRTRLTITGQKSTIRAKIDLSVGVIALCGTIMRSESGVHPSRKRSFPGADPRCQQEAHNAQDEGLKTTGADCPAPRSLQRGNRCQKQAARIDAARDKIPAVAGTEPATKGNGCQQSQIPEAQRRRNFRRL